MSYHRPVLLDECIDALNLKSDGTYVDLTFGGGGHSKAILSHLGPDGRLIAFDQDEDAQRNIIDDPRLTFIPYNFKHFERLIDYLQVGDIDGVLADLGVSSFQFDEKSRGFSYTSDSFMDMRMAKSQKLKAEHIIKKYSENDLVIMFSKYGEVRNAKQLSRKIVAERKSKDIKKIDAFVNMIEPCIIGGYHKYLAKVFQALRIEVNDEFKALEQMLEGLYTHIRVGGRLAIITFHSGEDRIVKRFLKTGNVEGNLEKDEYGNIISNFRLINKKPIVPTEKEIKANSRSRSAKLRIAERI